jgi:AraC-like DNA-binding protein
MDVISDFLERARAHGAVFALTRLRAPWGLILDELTSVTIHVVLSGDIALVVDNEPPHRLCAGDIAVVTRSRHHRLVSDLGATCASLDDVARYRLPGTDVFEVPGDGPLSEVLCGAYRFEGDVCQRLIEQLPAVVVVRAGDQAESSAMAATIALVANEVRHDGRGRSTMLDRLLDVLLVLVLRVWFADADHAPAWYRALNDPEIGRVLQLMHTQPGQPWSVASLASTVGLSRATLARRFVSLVGTPPLTYLTQWRLSVAANDLVGTERSVRSIAHSVGYDNEFAFATAFRRARGVSPTTWRHQRAG